MPEWGLTEELAASRPWGIPAAWFGSGKVITDPVHGDIYLNRLEQLVVDTPAFQRLRRTRQLGTTHLVYPGATHTRFSHSLGALRVAQNLFDVAYGQRNGRQPRVFDLFTQWDEERAEELQEVPLAEAEDRRREVHLKYDRRIAEAMVLARLGALLHDLCHVPFGHSIEDDLRILTPHDENGERLEDLWGSMVSWLEEEAERGASRGRVSPGDLRDLQPLLGGVLRDQLRPLILSKEEKDDRGKTINAADRIRYPFVADLVGNTICADLLDYLERDHRFTGLPMSLGRRYMGEFYVTPKVRSALYPERMTIRIHREGRERPDVVTELLKHLRYRYELQERVLVHHAKIAADAMVGKMLELWREAMRVEHRASASPRRGRRRQEEALARRIEQIVQHTGDDGLLEQIAQNGMRSGDAGASAAGLAKDLLGRRLHRHAANVAGAAAHEDLHAKFHDAGDRGDLERAAERWAELPPGPLGRILLWVPPPDMRLKLAEMLVDHGKGIAKFVDYSTQGREIYDAHRNLWTISVFVDRTVTPDEEREILAFLASEMGVCWDRHEALLGPKPQEWPRKLAAMEACGRTEVDAAVEELLAIIPSQVGRRGAATTHAALVGEFKGLRPALARRRRVARRRES
jgi:uncharacterized protein